MEDEFFASVLRKWAESSQQVVDLKKRLSEVEQERNNYQHQMSRLKSQAQNKDLVRRHSPISIRCDNGGNLDLDETSHKLEEARINYQRQLKELVDVRNSEQILKREVEELKKQRMELQSQVQVRTTQVNLELAQLQSEKETMTDTISDLRTRLQQAEQTNAEIQTKAAEMHSMGAQQVVKLQEKMVSLEFEIRELQSLTQDLESVNEGLRVDLAATQEYLQKARDSNAGLRRTIDKLSLIARNVKGVFQGVSPIQGSSTRVSDGIPKSPLTEVENVKQEPKVDVDINLSFNDVTIVAELDNGLSVSMSSRRKEALASLPIIIPNININDEDNKFTRSFTSAAIGGSIQCMIVRVSSSRTDLARGRNIEEYLCPRLDHNPWCPSIPGQHGYMFVGLGRDKNTYTIPKLCNLFVGIPKCGNKGERYFRYLGVYRVSRVESLNVSEWEALGQGIKQNYVQITKNKTRDPRPKEDILVAYDSGELSIPCVKLECVEFDDELYAGLLAFRAKHGTTQHSRNTKRNRDDDNEGNPHSQQTKRSAGNRLLQN